ncbi:MAG TPA: hypothetical protein PKU78_02995 [Candidatus Dojkabacteria bacterium]|nr:hypothetical protein [Candidatus Dojkabacteria bacterium]HRO65161.1 hypothetical protein [Candidatus Dojkabacteria bacterium]HRP51401.1 hypothetical protein [Candidatus Dojkabacteria bacterium]
MGIVSNSKISTQDHLEIEDIRDDLVLLKDGRVSLVIETGAVNFDLLSEEEQDAKIKMFAGMLNSLNFQMQVVILTERSDLTAYVEKLVSFKQQQASKALIRQIEIYLQFIKNLTYNREVLDKRFFIVIPEISAEVQRTGIVKQIFGKRIQITNRKAIFDKAKINLYPKRDHVFKQFKKMGIETWQLNNEQLVRLYYSMYDPDKIGAKNLELATTKYTSFKADENTKT